MKLHELVETMSSRDVGIPLLKELIGRMNKLNDDFSEKGIAYFIDNDPIHVAGEIQNFVPSCYIHALPFSAEAGKMQERYTGLAGEHAELVGRIQQMEIQSQDYDKHTNMIINNIPGFTVQFSAASAEPIDDIVAFRSDLSAKKRRILEINNEILELNSARQELHVESEGYVKQMVDCSIRLHDVSSEMLRHFTENYITQEKHYLAALRASLPPLQQEIAMNYSGEIMSFGGMVRSVSDIYKVFLVLEEQLMSVRYLDNNEINLLREDMQKYRDAKDLISGIKQSIQHSHKGYSLMLESLAGDKERVKMLALWDNNLYVIMSASRNIITDIESQYKRVIEVCQWHTSQQQIQKYLESKPVDGAGRLGASFKEARYSFLRIYAGLKSIREKNQNKTK